MEKIWVAIASVALLVELIVVLFSVDKHYVLEHQGRGTYKNSKKFHMKNDHKLKEFVSKLYDGSNPVGQNVNIWPMPKYFSNGTDKLYVSNDFQLKSAGSKYDDQSGILKDGFLRIMDLVKLDHSQATDVNFSEFDQSSFLKGINVVIHSPDDELQFGVDESYYLMVPDPMNPGYALIERLRTSDVALHLYVTNLALTEFKAESVYGALHGLQTFSQLCHYDFKTKLIGIDLIPWIIIDEPRFPHRGLLIDTARHHLPLPVIKKVIDSMTYSKLNVLHWHIVDSQSFPLEIPSYPNLWKGAYSTPERYTMEDAAEIVRYAQRRGVHVLAEIDVPGHAQSWGRGYPSLWPSPNCTQPLDVSNEFTFQVITGVLSDLRKIFKYKFAHLGGDEVDTGCWSRTPHIQKWLKNHNMNGTEAYQYFVLRAQKIALSLGYQPVVWEEPFRNFGQKLDPSTVVQNWLVTGVAQLATEAGFRSLMSIQDTWYLDHLDVSWDQFYFTEPLMNITDAEQQKLVIGGEVCMWGETVDTSDIEQTIWPRAAAAAERLWTPYENIAKDMWQVYRRLAHFRCLLNQRGIAAAPVNGYGRSAPYNPGSCYTQLY